METETEPFDKHFMLSAVYIISPLQVEYLLKKICMAMSTEFNCVEFEDFFSQDSGQQSGITVWVFLQMMNSGKITRGIDKSIISMAIEEVYREIVGDVLKEVTSSWSGLFPRMLRVEAVMC